MSLASVQVYLSYFVLHCYFALLKQHLDDVISHQQTIPRFFHHVAPFWLLPNYSLIRGKDTNPERTGRFPGSTKPVN